MKYTDNEILDYEQLNAQIKELTKKRDALKDKFIQNNGGESDTYQIILKDNFRETVASRAEFDALFGAGWLKENGLLKLSAFNTLVISIKAARKVG